MGRPLIGLIASVKSVADEQQPWHGTPSAYVQAAWAAAGGAPVVVPALGDDAESLVRHLDGLLLTGDVSNVHPDHYGGALSCPPHDPARDLTAFALVRAALAAGLPLLAICRGFQELNVALGGTLHPKVHDLPDRLDHRSDSRLPLAEQYGRLAHPVRLEPGGALHRLVAEDEVRVNSLHGQGLDRLAPGLVVEATAPDGLVEAVRVEGAGFAFGVQWHPEWGWQDHRLNAALFKAFGDAARTRALSQAAKAE